MGGQRPRRRMQAVLCAGKHPEKMARLGAFERAAQPGAFKVLLKVS